MPIEGVNATGANATANTQNQNAGGMDAATQQQFDQSVSTVFASILSPMVQMVLSNCSE